MTSEPRYPSGVPFFNRLGRMLTTLAVTALIPWNADAQWTDAGAYIHATDAPNVVVTDSGRLGVGTATPLSALHVAGEIRFDLGEGLLFYSNPDFWGASQDSRNIRIIDQNSSQASVDGGLVIETYTSSDNFRLPLLTVRHNATDQTYFGFGALYPEHLFSLNSTWTLGTGKVDVSGVDVFGTGTSFLSAIEPGSEVLIGGAVRRVKEVLSDTHLVVAKPFIGTNTLANLRYNRPLFWITEQGQVTIGTPSGTAGLNLNGPFSVGGNEVIDAGGHWTGPTSWVDLTSNQAIDGSKAFEDQILAVGGLQIGDNTNGRQLDLYSGYNAIDFYLEGGGRYGRISTNASNDFILQASTDAKFRIAHDLYLQASSLSSWRTVYAGNFVARSSFGLADGSGSTKGELRLSGSDTIFEGDPGSTLRIEAHLKVHDSLQAEDGMQVKNGLDVTGNLVLHPLPTGSSNGQVCYVATGSGDYLVKCSSSERFKKDIERLGNGLAIVERLRPVTYAWTENGERDLGFVAEEVAQVEPLLAAVSQGTIEGVRYDKLTAVLVDAMQEQQAEIRRQQEQIEALLALLCVERKASPICSGS